MKLVSLETLVPPTKKYVFAFLKLFESDRKKRYISKNNSLSGRNDLKITVKKKDSIDKIQSPPYYLQNGKIKNQHIFQNIESISTEQDYVGISTKFTIKMPYDKDRLNFIKKGVRGVLRLVRYENEEEYRELLQPQYVVVGDDAEERINGYIDEYEVNKDFITLDFVGASSLLDKKCDAEFKHMKRSEILREVIREAGLNAVIDFTGLPDDVIDFTTRNESEAKEMKGEGLTGGDDAKSTYDLCVRHGFGLSKCMVGVNDFDKDFKAFANPKRKYYQKARELGDADSVLGWFRKNYKWRDYPDNHHNNPDETLENIVSNCADSNRLLAAMLQSVGVSTVLLHGSPYGRGHYFCSAKLDDKWHMVDTCYWNRRGEKSTNTYGK